MSIRLVGQMWNRNDLRGIEKFVALGFALYADDEGLASPTQDRIAELCGLRPAQVTRAVQKLRKRGVLTRLPRTGRRVHWRLQST